MRRDRRADKAKESGVCILTESDGIGSFCSCHDGFDETKMSRRFEPGERIKLEITPAERKLLLDEVLLLDDDG